jgi:quinol monooxygenase YgiN
MSEVQLIARYTVTEGKQDEVLDLLPRLIEATRQEPGNLSYRVYRELGDSRGIVLLERYASREALAAHRETAHFKELVLNRIVPLLDERTVEEYEVADGQ